MQAHQLTQQSANWWARPRGSESQAWIANYQQSVMARHRTSIVEAVKALRPTTLLEVGCHCGPNLVRLAREVPTLQMIGLDVNAQAIHAGRAWVQQEQLGGRIQLNTGQAPTATEALPTGMCDVVLSCYTLAYIAPTDLDAVLSELGRLSTTAVVLAEPMTTGRSIEARAVSGYTEWAHDYQAASGWIGTLRGRQTRIVPIDPPVDRLNGIFVASV